ncbi:MAG: polyisoprenoid-binding protein [Deltaproteobacteria bacterium]|nr:polyisoprenoid-binding protein [Deltaproteobacteria bacterium]
MNRFIRILAIAAICLIPLSAMASNWTIDPDHSNIQFKIRHMMIANVNGTFGKVKGLIRIDEKDMSQSAVDATIEIDSINTGVTKRDEHLKSVEFFDSAKYPTMTFVSRKVIPDGKGQLKILGDLTIHGISREVALDVEGPTNEIKDPLGNTRRGASATTKINRMDFGLNWNKPTESGGMMIDETVFINLEIEMIKEKGTE